MDNRKALNFLKYINTPMSRESIIVLYNANNIKYEKCELYNEFIQSLIFLIYDTSSGVASLETLVGIFFPTN